MEKLSFDRSSDEGLVLCGQDGAEYTLEVTAELRTAVRQAAPPPEPAPLPADIPDNLRPKDIQALVRGGASPEELSQRSGQDANYVARYAAPVLDERAYVARRAQAIEVDKHDAAPTLGELALQRLEDKGIDPDTLVWDAILQDGAWIVRLSFATEKGTRSGRWEVDLNGNSFQALDQTAEWITEPEPPDSPVPPPTRHLQAVSDDAPNMAEQVADSAPLSLLDNLMDARGLRQVAPIDPSEARSDHDGPGDVVELRRPLTGPGSTVDSGPEPLEPLEPPEPQAAKPDRGFEPRFGPIGQTGSSSQGAYRPTNDATQAFPAYSSYGLDDPESLAQAQDQVETERVSIKDRVVFHEPTLADAHQEPDEPPAPEPETKPRSRAKRSSVPSWDEIVFGASRTD